jgi:branched-chain amino acid transport system substrate-binding protein
LGVDRARPLRVAACAAALAAACRAPAPRPVEAPPAPLKPLVVTSPDTRADGALHVATIFPTVGRFSLSGIQSRNGARMAAADVNAAGGIHARRLRLLEYETGSYFADARHAAVLAAEHSRALAIVGSNASSLSEAIAGIADTRGVVQVSNVSTADDLTWDPVTGRDRPYVFRVCPSDVVIGRTLAAFAREHLDARRAAILYEVSRTYSAKLARSFADAFADPARGRVAAEFFYLPLETDFRQQLREVEAFRADVLFLPGSFSDATLIAGQAEKLGLRPTLLGGDAWSNRLLFKRASPARTSYHADHCAPPAAFLERYRREFGVESDGCRAVLAYDAVQAIAAGLRALPPLSDAELAGDELPRTRDRLRDAVAGVSIAGVGGRVQFDANGDVVRGVAMVAVTPGPAGVRTRLQGWLGPH